MHWHVCWPSVNFFHLFPMFLPFITTGVEPFFQLNGREQNFYCWGVHQYSCSSLNWHHNVLVLTNVTTGQIIILRHRQNLWMGKSFRGTKSTFHLWELLVHALLGSQMDAGGAAFKSSGSGKNTSYSITGRLMPVFLALKQILWLCCFHCFWQMSLYFWHCGSLGRLPAISFLSCGSVTPGDGDCTEANGSSCLFWPFSAFWPWHWENMSCGILPFTLGWVPAIIAFKGRMPVNPLLWESPAGGERSQHRDKYCLPVIFS